MATKKQLSEALNKLFGTEDVRFENLSEKDLKKLIDVIEDSTKFTNFVRRVVRERWRGKVRDRGGKAINKMLDMVDEMRPGKKLLEKILK